MQLFLSSYCFLFVDCSSRLNSCLTLLRLLARDPHCFCSMMQIASVVTCKQILMHEGHSLPMLHAAILCSCNCLITSCITGVCMYVCVLDIKVPDSQCTSFVPVMMVNGWLQQTLTVRSTSTTSTRWRWVLIYWCVKLESFLIDWSL